MAGKLRFEPWTLPTAASFVKADISMPVVAAEGRRELSAFSDCRCQIPDSWTKLSVLATHPLVRVMDGDTVVDEFVVERRPRALRDGATLDASGPQLGQWGLSRTLVYPPDYGTNPSKRPNWKWGMENLIDLDVGGLGNVNERWTFYLSGERYELDTSLATTGDFTLTVGGNTTSAIAYDAEASAIKSALEALAGVTDVTVDQPDADTREFFVVFEDPKDLASDMTANFTGTGGLGSLTKLSDGFDTGTSPTFSMTVDLQTTGNIAWNASANTVEGSATGGTGLQGLSNVSDVAVSGSGTYDDPFDITFINPPTISNFGVTFSAGTAVVTRVVDGGYSADPVTISKPIDEGTGPEEVHGTYGTPALEVVTDVVDTGADFSVLVRARSRFAGSQLVLNVETGEIYQASIRVRPVANSSYVLVIHDEFQNQIARTADTPITADTWGTLSLSDILIPAGVERVIMRVAVVSNTTGNHYVNWQGARFVTGLEETNPGDIVGTILAHSQAQGDGTWIDFTADETNDSASTAWTQSYSYQADGFAMHLLHVLEDMRDLGYEFTLTPKATPVGSLTHDLNLYMPQGAGTDRTTTGPALMTGGAIVDGEVVDRIPDFTTAVAWGANDLYLEDENASTVATYGRLTKVVDIEQHADAATLQDALDTAFSDEETNRQAGSVMLSGSGTVVPFVHVDVGDTLVWQAGDRMAKNNRRVQTITWRHGDPVATYEIQGSRVWSDPLAAIAEGLRRLMDAPKKRKRGEGKTSKIVEPGTGGGSNGAHIHLNRTSTQSLTSGTAAAIEWETEHGAILRENFAAPAFDTDAITIQEPGYYDVQVMVGLASAVTTGEVSVVRVRNSVETTVWPPTSDPGLWSATYSTDLFSGTAKAIPCESGDQIKVYVEQTSGSPVNLTSAAGVIEKVDQVFKGPAGDAYRDLVLSHGPILYLRLGEGSGEFYDETGNGHNGTLQTYSTPAVTNRGVDPLIQTDQAIEFESGVRYVEVPDSEDFDVAAITVEAWIKTSDTNAQAIVTRDHSVSTSSALWQFTIRDTGRLRFTWDAGGDTIAGVAAVDDGATHHVAVTHDGSTVRLYIDGEEDANSAADPLATGSEEIRVGTWRNVVGAHIEPFVGTVDEVAVYGRALSADEIAAHHNVGRSG